MQKKKFLWLLAMIMIIVPLIFISSKSKSLKNLITSQHENDVGKTTKIYNYTSKVTSMKQKISKEKHEYHKNIIKN